MSKIKKPHNCFPWVRMVRGVLQVVLEVTGSTHGPNGLYCEMNKY